MKLNQSIEFYIKSTSLALSRMYNKIAKQYGITQTIGYVLMYVEKNGTPATKLAWSLGMKDSSLTRLLKKMEKNGLISRIKDKEDKRITRIFLTKEGIEKRRMIKKIVLNFNQKIAEKIGEENLQTFYKVFDIINKQISSEATYKI
jgi:DNA-binding MarR family transcriptional regulator